MSEKDMGCPYRKWGWHDGDPDHLCMRDGKQNTCCEDSWSDWFQCDYVRQEYQKPEEVEFGCIHWERGEK